MLAVHRGAFIVLVGLLAAVPRPAPPVVATTAGLSFSVTTTVDAPDAHPGDGLCADSAGQCTLRAAVQEADAQPAGSSIAITVPAGAYTLTLGPLVLSANRMAISGAGRAATSISGNNSSTVVAISATVRAALRGLTITGGNAAGDGGGILNQGRLVLTQSAVLSNTAAMPYPAGNGGGIANSGTLLVISSTLSGNTGYVSGGGISNAAGAALAVAGSVISGNGSPYGDGGGIANSGTLTMLHSTLSGNGAEGIRRGGGIANSGTLTIVQSALSGNTDSSGGGGIYNTGALRVISSTLSGNTAGGFGGGIYNDIAGTLSVTQSTFSGNMVPHGGGGGITNRGSLSVIQSTSSGDTDGGTGGGIDNGGTGGGIDNGGAAASVDGTIVADGCAGAIAERQGYNPDSGASCGFSRSTDLTNTTPLLGPLQNNGGPTQTMALLPGSPAIDRGGTPGQGCPAADQRGYARLDAGETRCDIGAFESGATTGAWHWGYGQPAPHPGILPAPRRRQDEGTHPVGPSLHHGDRDYARLCERRPGGARTRPFS